MSPKVEVELARLVLAPEVITADGGRVELSGVLKAMAIEPDVGMGAIRFSLGRATTREEVDAVVGLLAEYLAAAA